MHKTNKKPNNSMIGETSMIIISRFSKEIRTLKEDLMQIRTLAHFSLDKIKSLISLEIISISKINFKKKKFEKMLLILFKNKWKKKLKRMRKRREKERKKKEDKNKKNKKKFKGKMKECSKKKKRGNNRRN